MGHTLLPSVHEHLDSYRRPLDGKSKFSIRVAIGSNKKLYPIDTSGDQELYMDRKFWVNEKDENGKRLKVKRIQKVKGNPDAKKVERILKSKVKEMTDLISRLAGADKAITHDLLERLWSRQGTATFHSWAVRWYEQYAKDKNHREISQETYKYCLQILQQYEDYAGTISVSQVSVDWLKQFQTWLYRKPEVNENGKVLGKGFSMTAGPRTMRRIGMMVKNAALEGEIFTNTYHEFVERGYYIQEEETIGSFLEKDELERLHTAYVNEELIDKIKTPLGNISIHGQRLHDRLGMILFVAYTGLRYGDLKKVAQGHEDVSISRDKITVVMSKTGKTVRLKIHNKLREVANLDGIGPVFNSRIIKNSNLNVNLRQICKLVGISKYITIHGLRRTFATYLLGEGARMKMVSALVGHSSVTTTEKKYAKVADKSLDETMDLFDGETTNFTKPDVLEFVQDVYRLFQANDELNVSHRLADKMKELKELLDLDQLKVIQLEKNQAPNKLHIVA